MDLLAYALVAVFTAGTVLVLAAVTRRLLGPRFGIVRTLAAGIVALVVLGPLFSAMRSGTDRDADGSGPFWLLVLAIALSLLAAMVFLVLAEVLVPAGSVPPPYEWGRLVRSRVARTRRYGHIVRIAVRHGLGLALRGRADPRRRQELARSLTAALDEGGVTFVKLGQVLSTRRDLLPAEFVTELGRLQDRAAAVPWAEVEATLVAELGRPVAEVFAAVSPEPLAAASIAQVHVATLTSGEEVVLKIQRPGIGPRHHLQQRVADRDRVAAVDGQQQLLQRGPDGHVQPPDRAEIQQRQPPVGEQQHVARVRVGVEDPVQHDLPQQGAEQRAGQRVPVQPARRSPARPQPAAPRPAAA